MDHALLPLFYLPHVCALEMEVYLMFGSKVKYVTFPSKESVYKIHKIYRKKTLVENPIDFPHKSVRVRHHHYNFTTHAPNLNVRRVILSPTSQLLGVLVWARNNQNCAK
jgi:hypothetical protein